MPNSEILSELTEYSKPSISEIVQLFDGMQVILSLKNFVRVIHSRYEAEPLKVGIKPSRFSSPINISNEAYYTTMRMLYGAQTIDTAIYETIVRNRFDINPNRFLDSVHYEEMSVVSLL